ncbi:MAG: hypothetical protein PHW69_01780 [Elusimicrobiaceae bacterium]|nr:hypothetical protein [Elusimicrobiaceae bacterium]
MRKSLLLAGVFLVSGCAFAGDTHAVVKLGLPPEFANALPASEAGMRERTAFSILERVYKEGSLPRKNELNAVWGGHAFPSGRQNSAVNFYLVGRQIYFSMIITDKFGFGRYGPPRNPQFSVMAVYKRFGTATCVKLKERFKKNENVLMPLAAEGADSMYAASKDNLQDRFYLRRYGSYLVVKHTRNGKTAAYAYLFYRLDHEGLSEEDFTQEPFNEAE